MKHDKAKSLRDRWSNMDKHLKEEEATVAKFKDQLKQYEESVKQEKTKPVAVNIELGETLQDFNEARTKELDNDDSVDEEAPAEMVAPVPGPTQKPSPEPMPAEAQLARADGKQRLTQQGPEATGGPRTTAAPAKKARTDGDSQMEDVVVVDE